MDEVRKVTLKERVYLIGSLDVIKQFHVARRLGPLVLSFFAGAATSGEGGEEVGFASLLSPQLVEYLASVDDAQAEYIIYTCLSAVRVQNPDNSSVPVYNAALKRLQFQDLQMPDMITLVQNVIKDNLGSFFPSGQPELNQG